MQRKFCSLCFAPCDNFAEPIEEAAREPLAQLLQHLDINNQGDLQVACTNCSTRLRGYLEFKINFLQTQASIRSFGSERSSDLVDLRPIYLQNIHNESEVDAREDVVVCRFCLKQVTSACTPLVEGQKELILVPIMMNKCFPGLELGAMSGYVICVPCHKALEEAYSFILSLDVENCIKKEDAVEEMEFEEGPEVKTELFVTNKFESGDDCVDLNAVKKVDSFTANGDDFDRGVEVTAEAVKEEQTTSESVSVKASAVQLGVVYKCESCVYETKERGDLTRHMLVHKNPSEVNMYKCKCCSYELKYSYSNRGHVDVHERYNCMVCTYKTECKADYDCHMLTHDNPPVETVHRCEVCSFETTYERSYKRHMLIHKNPSEVTMYKCSSCSYETRHRGSLKRHATIHKGCRLDEEL